MIEYNNSARYSGNTKICIVYTLQYTHVYTIIHIQYVLVSYYRVPKLLYVYLVHTYVVHTCYLTGCRGCRGGRASRQPQLQLPPASVCPPLR